jgi:PAS domain S-box-containing protein
MDRHVLPTVDQAQGGPLTPAPMHNAAPCEATGEMQQRLRELEQELQHTRETLQARITTLQTRNAELQATNQELAAANAQRQSTNEALQVANAKLRTVNAEYQRAEEAARRSQAQLQQILDNAPAVIHIKDTEGRYLLVNRQYETLLGMRSEQILGHTAADIHPLEAARTLMAHDQQVLTTNAPSVFEEVEPNGTRTYLSVKFPLRDAAGVPYALCGISTDISLRKQAEAALQDAKSELERRVQELSRLTTILEVTPDLVAIADTRERVLYLNAAGRRMLGIAAEEPLRSKVADFIPAHVLRVIREEGAPLARQHGTWTGEAVVIGGDGRDIPVSLVIIAHTSPSGEVEAFSTIMRDITEQQRAQEMLRRRADEMETFAYSASHDLQAPLRTFEGYARWLLEDYGHALDAEGRQLCEEIMADAVHMKTLLDGLLEYSRIGRLDPQAVPVDVKMVLEWVLHDLQLEIADKGATLHLPEVLPTVVYPEGRLTQVFSNLISNALKFTADRPPEITIGCEEHPGYYRFTVRDNGLGIAPEHHARIFEIFKRLHPREVYPGTGVGLTIVKRIVETHGGQIGVESALGEGATFWLTIPKTKPPPCAAGGQ